MQEGDLKAEEALPRHGVDELDAARPQPLELCADVLDLVGDVVHPRPATGEEPAHRRLVPERGEQLDAAVPDEHGHGLDALVGHAIPVLDPRAEEPLVRGHRLVELRDGDAEVMDRADGHRRRC